MSIDILDMLIIYWKYDTAVGLSLLLRNSNGCLDNAHVCCLSAIYQIV